MKLTPASRDFATIRVEVASSVGSPNIMVPRQIGEIFRPLRPRLRYCMGLSPLSVVGKISARDRHCEEQSDEAIQSRHSGRVRLHQTRNLEVPASILPIAPDRRQALTP